jgi:hypothetical protein
MRPAHARGREAAAHGERLESLTSLPHDGLAPQGKPRVESAGVSGYIADLVSGAGVATACRHAPSGVAADLDAEPALRAVGDRCGARIDEANGVGALPIAQALHLKPVFAILARQVADDECGHLRYLQKI